MAKLGSGGDGSGGLDAAVFRDPLWSVKPRARALLITEIQGLESLFAATSKNAPDRPRLMRRLQGAYLELEAAARRDELAASSDAAAQEKARKVSIAARTRSVEHGTRLRDEYPSFAQGDAALLTLGAALERGGDLSGARKRYYELIKSYPRSKLIPRAYLAFGELFFSEAKSDPTRWSLAQQAYTEVVKYPPPEDDVFAYGELRLGQVFAAQHDHPRALTAFKRAIEAGGQYPAFPESAKVVELARRETVTEYAAAGDPDKAYTFLHPLAGDVEGSSERTFALMETLANAFVSGRKPAQAAAILRDLMVRDRAHASVYQQRLAELPK